MQVRRIVDFTANEGSLAKLCLRKRVSYTGVCLTEQHVEKLERHLIKTVFNYFVEANNEFYNVSLAAVVDELKDRTKTNIISPNNRTAYTSAVTRERLNKIIKRNIALIQRSTAIR